MIRRFGRSHLHHPRPVARTRAPCDTRPASPPRTQSGGSSDSDFMSPVAFEGDCDYDDDMTDDGEITDPSRRPGAGGSHAPSPQNPRDGSIGVRRLAAEAQVAELQRRLEEAAEAHAREVGELREKLQRSNSRTPPPLPSRSPVPNTAAASSIAAPPVPVRRASPSPPAPPNAAAKAGLSSPDFENHNTGMSS